MTLFNSLPPKGLGYKFYFSEDVFEVYQNETRSEIKFVHEPAPYILNPNKLLCATV